MLFTGAVPAGQREWQWVATQYCKVNDSSPSCPVLMLHHVNAGGGCCIGCTSGRRYLCDLSRLWGFRFKLPMRSVWIGEKTRPVLAGLQAAFPYDFPDTRAAADLAVLLGEEDDAERKRRPKGRFPDPTVVDWSRLATDSPSVGNLPSVLSYHLQDAGKYVLLPQRTTLYLEEQAMLFCLSPPA